MVIARSDAQSFHTGRARRDQTRGVRHIDGLSTSYVLSMAVSATESDENPG
jgi:hypothetical protein